MARLEKAPAWTARADAFSTYKSGFEVRCYRLCRRILMFHRTGESPELVRETRLRYDGDASLGKLVGVTSLGWRGAESIGEAFAATAQDRERRDAARREPGFQEPA